MQPSRNTANNDASVGMQCSMQLCRWPVDGSKLLETASQPLFGGTAPISDQDCSVSSKSVAAKAIWHDGWYSPEWTQQRWRIFTLDWLISRKPTFDLMVRSERLAAAAAILRMSGLLLDFMISRRENVSEFNKGKKERKCLVLGGYWMLI